MAPFFKRTKMVEIDVTSDMLVKAHAKSKEMGILHNSITQGDGNLVGFIGELIAQQILGGENKNTYDYDLILDGGKTVDVKTKKTGYVPLPDYDCSVAAFNTKQACDYYAFVRVKNDLSKGWFLGVYPKTDYFKNARFLKKGQLDPANNYTVKADCYNMFIKDLQDKV